MIDGYEDLPHLTLSSSCVLLCANCECRDAVAIARGCVFGRAIRGSQKLWQRNEASPDVAKTCMSARTKHKLYKFCALKLIPNFASSFTPADSQNAPGRLAQW